MEEMAAQGTQEVLKEETRTGFILKAGLHLADNGL